MKQNPIGPAIKLFLFLTVVTGLAYPLLMTAVSQALFHHQASGSFITASDGKVIGSELIAQGFKNPKYFWPRPSGVDYNPMPSGASNLGPTSKDLVAKIKERREQGFTRDLLFASGSGLDPHISPEAAADQIKRVSDTRHVDAAALQKLVNEFTERRQWHFLGEERVNVLRLNVALDKQFPGT